MVCAKTGKGFCPPLVKGAGILNGDCTHINIRQCHLERGIYILLVRGSLVRSSDKFIDDAFEVGRDLVWEKSINEVYSSSSLPLHWIGGFHR